MRNTKTLALKTGVAAVAALGLVLGGSMIANADTTKSGYTSCKTGTHYALDSQVDALTGSSTTPSTISLTAAAGGNTAHYVGIAWHQTANGQIPAGNWEAVTTATFSLTQGTCIGSVS